MRGAHAARAALLMISCGCCGGAMAGQYAAAPQPAFDPRSSGLAELEPTTMPGGMAGLCARDPSFCAPVTEVPRSFILSPERWSLLREVNESVNHTIISTTDRQLYGEDEYWTIPTTAGDCEDFVLLKRQMLMQDGVEESSLLITVVHDENGEGHAVLTIPTPEGDLVLDNRRDAILHWWDTGYTFLKRQSESNPDQWVSLGRETPEALDIASGPGLP